MRPPSDSASRRLRRISFVLAGLVVLPACVLLGYESVMRSRTEALVAQVYDQQLEPLLHAVNQHAYAVMEAERAALTQALHADGILAESGGSDARAPLAHSMGAVNESPVLEAAQLYLAAPPVRSVFQGAEGKAALAVLADSDAAIAQARGKLAHRMQSDADYLPIESFELTEDLVGVLMPLRGDDAPLAVVAFRRDAFVQGVLVPKLAEVAQGAARAAGAGGEASSTFDLALYRDEADAPVLSTSGEPFRREHARRVRPLWVLPGYDLGIRLSGATVDAFVAQRMRRSLAVGAILLVVLGIGGALVYRGVRREVALARLQQDFVSNVSHELRTPLALIRMYAETLALGRVPTEARRQEYVEVILHETERLTRLVAGVLSFAKMEAGERQYAPRALDLADEARETLRLYAFSLDQHGMTVDAAFDPAAPAVWADPEAVQEALHNLVDNAIKYGAEGGSLTVRVEPMGRGGTPGAAVCVADRGPGVPPEARARIFDKFYRAGDGEADVGLTTRAKGTGLGLALVRHIAEAHDGAVWLDDGSPGAASIGACFRLWFPAAPAPSAPSTASS